MKKKTALLATAALGGLLLASTAGPAYADGNGAEAKGECSGVNSCKGTGACQGKGHSCAGENACKGQGWLKLTEKECADKGGEFKGN